MVFQFNQSLIRFFFTVKLWYLEHQHIKYHEYVEISVIFLCILTSDSISWVYECFEVSSLFHWVWDNMIYTILSLYYTCLKKVFVLFDILKYCYFRSLAVCRWSGWPVLPVGPLVSKTSSFLWVLHPAT